MKVVNKYGYLIAWTIALVSTLGSLFFSEVLLFPPCNLCWYQRIFMYPLVAIIAIGIIARDKYTYRYILPLSIGGGLIAFYQVLLERGVIPSSFAPCTIGVSCTSKYISLFGFLTIPLMSFLAFAIITVLMFSLRRDITNEPRG